MCLCVCIGDLPEQISSTLVPRMENFQITSEDIDHDQVVIYKKISVKV